MWEWDSLLGSILPETMFCPAQTSCGGGTSKAGSAREQRQGKEKSSAPCCAKTTGTKVGLGAGASGSALRLPHDSDSGKPSSGKEKGKDKGIRRSPLLVITPERRRKRSGSKLAKLYEHTTEEGLVVKPYLLYLRIVCVMCCVCIILHTWRNTKVCV